jgi:hypothetical protein
MENHLVEFMLDAVYGSIAGNAAYDYVKSFVVKHFGRKPKPKDKEELAQWAEKELETNPAFAEELQQIIATYSKAGEIQVINTGENVKIVSVGTNIGDIHL